MRFVLEERGARRLEAGPGFSPTISLTRGEPVSIMVVNHLTEPTAACHRPDSRHLGLRRYQAIY